MDELKNKLIELGITVAEGAEPLAKETILQFQNARLAESIIAFTIGVFVLIVGFTIIKISYSNLKKYEEENEDDEKCCLCCVVMIITLIGTCLTEGFLLYEGSVALIEYFAPIPAILGLL